MLSNQRKAIVSRIGETDQLYLTENTPELALERAELRMQLVTLSRVRQEVYSKLLRLPAQYYLDNSSGHITDKIMYNVEQLTAASSESLKTSFQEDFIQTFFFSLLFN